MRIRMAAEAFVVLFLVLVILHLALVRASPNETTRTLTTVGAPVLTSTFATAETGPVTDTTLSR